MNHLRFTHEKLSVEDITDLVASPKCGAVSSFIGMTRNNFEGKDVVKLEYEAYETMGIKAMEKICDVMRSQWPDIENIAIIHRLGIVPVKEASIIIAISSPHRTEAIKATDWCIDHVKKSVPIWKKEVYKENTSEWKQNKELENLPKSKKFIIESSQEVELKNIPSHLVQIKASSDEIDQRIKRFMERKRQEINIINIRDFCRKDASDSDNFSCARIDSVLIKRKDSKGHLQVNKVYNNYSRDQSKLDYLLKFIPKDGVEERVANLESQLSLTKSVPCDIYKRLKLLEDRLLHLESISPEYIQFWDKSTISSKGPNKKKIFSMNEIDSIINDLESRRNKD